MKFKHMRSRIAFYMLTVTFTALLFCWLILFFYFREILSRQAIDDHYAMISQFASEIDRDYSYVTDYTAVVVYDALLLDALERYEQETGFWKFSAQTEISERVANYMLLTQNTIYDMYVVNREGTYSISSYGRHSDLLLESWYQKTLVSGKGLTSPHQTINNAVTHQKLIDTFSYVRPLVKLDGSFEVLGYLVVDFSMDHMFWNSSALEKDGYFIADEAGVFFSKTGAKAVELPLKNLSNVSVELYEGQYYCKVYMEHFGKYFVGMLDQAVIDNAMSGSIRLMSLNLCCGILITLVAVIFLSKSITKPVLALTDGMKKAIVSRFQTQLPLFGRDELSELTGIFNGMQADIRKLIEQNEQIYKRDRDLQMKYYMSKINPHFLYNSLNCVIYLTRKERYSELIPFTRALISILRRNIAMGDAPISLKEEEEYLNNYFEILKYRYNDSIYLKLKIPQELEPCSIQPMILYPLVENAIFHGIAPSGRKGTVEVEVRENGDKVLFLVKDNGIGISEVRRREVLDYLSDNKNRSIYGSIGLKNVNDRLRLLYTSCSGLSLWSEEEKGTEITFSIEKRELYGGSSTAFSA